MLDRRRILRQHSSEVSGCIPSGFKGGWDVSRLGVAMAELILDASCSTM